MPEGDTIHKIAAYLSPRLTGQRLLGVSFGSGDKTPRFRGERVASVCARGKHLWLTFDSGETIRSHLGMHGSWHAYPRGAAWQKPSWQASLIIDAGGQHYVCFNAKEVEVVDTRSVRKRVLRSRLGPDLIADSVDSTVLLRRAREFSDGDTLLIDALLDQRIAAGIGNVYKSEVMFIERLSPAQALSDSDDDEVQQCFATAAALLRRNLGGGKRITRFDGDTAGRLWVYNRAGKPCYECNTPVRSRRMGRHHRVTYWCPGCQAAGSAEL